VAQAPIEELLLGKGNVTYSVVVEGDAADVKMRITQFPWVSAVNVTAQNGHAAMLVNVTDQAKAEDELLKAIMNSGTKVVEFGRKKMDLEDVFMSVVEGNGNGN
jgi:ABC-2 type transport system ATP-binding protein